MIIRIMSSQFGTGSDLSFSLKIWGNSEKEEASDLDVSAFLLWSVLILSFCFPISEKSFPYGMPDLLKGKQFDYIICTYAIHHLQDEQKLTFIGELLDYLSPDGKILIGDVAFETKAEYEKCKSENIE